MVDAGSPRQADEVVVVRIAGQGLDLWVRAGFGDTLDGDDEFLGLGEREVSPELRALENALKLDQEMWTHDDGEASCERSPHKATGHPTWGKGRGDEDVGIEDDAHRRLKLRAPCLLLLGPERS